MEAEPAAEAPPKLPRSRGRIQPTRDLAAELRRVVHEQCDLLVSWAGTDRAELGDVVHRVRQCSKRLRATVRLLRRELGEDEFKRFNARLRDEARRLAAARDADVALSLLDRLLAESDAPSEEARALRADLADSLHAARHEMRKGGALPAVARSVRTLESQLLARIPARLDAPALRKGLRDAHRRARRQLERAKSTPTADALHEFRKRAKTVRHQLELLQGSSAKLGERVRLLDELNGFLGDERDLALLAVLVAKRIDRDEPSRARVLYEILGRIESRRQALRAKLAASTARAFDEDDTAFAKRALPSGKR